MKATWVAFLAGLAGLGVGIAGCLWPRWQTADDLKQGLWVQCQVTVEVDPPEERCFTVTDNGLTKTEFDGINACRFLVVASLSVAFLALLPVATQGAEKAVKTASCLSGALFVIAAALGSTGVAVYMKYAKSQLPKQAFGLGLYLMLGAIALWISMPILVCYGRHLYVKDMITRL